MGDDDYTLTPVDHDPFYISPIAGNPMHPNWGVADPDTIARPPTLSAYMPTLSERVGAAAQDAMTGLGASKGYAQRFGTGAKNLAGLTPMSAGYDAGRALGAGNYAQAAVNALGALPDGGAGMAGLASHAMFAGPLARTADKAALETATKMAAEGADRTSIWSTTGWFTGADGKWRFEIPDNQAVPIPSGVDLALDHGPMRQGEVMSHPDYYSAYPSAKNISLSFDPRPGSKGGYSPAIDAEDRPNISLNEGMVFSRNPQTPISTWLHENQHAVQDVEGFAKGANQTVLRPGTPAWDLYQERLKDIVTPPSLEDFAKSWGGTPEEAAADYAKHVKTLRGYAKKGVPPMIDRLAQQTAVEQAYQRSAGEVEARNVQKRLPMTPEERAATPPWQTQDVPDDKQIVGFRNSGPQMSVDAGDGDHTLTPVQHDPFTEGAAEATPGITAYHGSPHSFDKFDASKIGTGEGAQAYGHGLYFAGNEGVAKSYRDALSNTLATSQGRVAHGDADHAIMQAGRLAAPNVSQSRLDTLSTNITEALRGGFDPKEAVSTLATNDHEREAGNAMLEAAKQFHQGPPGHMYQVAINAHPDHFLDWDKPLSEQHPHVQEAVKKLPSWSVSDSPTAKGSLLYRSLGGIDNNAKATEYLKSAGIPGIRYFDAGSRGKDGGSRNYVVFDHHLVNILKKYARGGDIETALRAAHGVMAHV